MNETSGSAIHLRDPRRTTVTARKTWVDVLAVGACALLTHCSGGDAGGHDGGAVTDVPVNDTGLDGGMDGSPMDAEPLSDAAGLTSLMVTPPEVTLTVHDVATPLSQAYQAVGIATDGSS